MIPKKTIGHFLVWFVVSVIIFYLLTDILRIYAVVGSALILIVYYLVYFKKRYFLPAIIGWGIALLITQVYFGGII